MENIENEIKSYLALEGYNVAKIESALGMSRSTVYNTLSRKSTTFRLAEKIADKLGYDIVWVRRESGSK